jgi:hypothetical protein
MTGRMKAVLDALERKHGSIIDNRPSNGRYDEKAFTLRESFLRRAGLGLLINDRPVYQSSALGNLYLYSYEELLAMLGPREPTLEELALDELEGVL